MANGERRPISEIEVGDQVLATDPETGESVGREVLATMPHTDQLLTLRTSSGEIVTTEDHKYWNSSDGQWQESRDLDPGDELLTADGDEVLVEGLDWSTVHTAPAYDLDVEGIDSYYVGAGDESVLVHNCSPSTPTGSRGNPLDVADRTNAASRIGGRDYSGHALDRMQRQGITPSVVENTVRPGNAIGGKVPGTTAYYDSVNDITVVTDTASGRVVTVDYGRINQ